MCSKILVKLIFFHCLNIAKAKTIILIPTKFKQSKLRGRKYHQNQRHRLNVARLLRSCPQVAIIDHLATTWKYSLRGI